MYTLLISTQVIPKAAFFSLSAKIQWLNVYVCVTYFHYFHFFSLYKIQTVLLEDIFTIFSSLSFVVSVFFSFVVIDIRRIFMIFLSSLVLKTVIGGGGSLCTPQVFFSEL